MKSSIPYLQVVTAMLIIGSFVVVNKSITRTFPIFLASELRLAMGAIILTILLLIREKQFPALGKQDLLILFTQSFIGVFLFSFFMLYGLTFTTAMESGIITSMTPALVGLISFLFFKERLSWNQNVGIALAVVGALAINVFGGLLDASWSFQTLLGNLLIFCAVVGEAVFITFGKLVSKKVSPLAVATITSLIAAVLFLPFALYNMTNFDFVQVSGMDWLLVLYTAIMVTVIAILLLNEGISKISTGSAAVFTALMPVSAILLSVVFLDERFYWYHFLGISFVFIGIAFSSISRIQKQQKKSEVLAPDQ